MINLIIKLNDSEAQNLAQQLIWNSINFSVRYEGLKCVFEINYSEQTLRIVKGLFNEAST